MRTTLDLDDALLAAARSLARSRGVSLGRAVSDLALRGLSPLPLDPDAAASDDFPTLPYVDGHLITDELVARHRDEPAAG